MSSSGFADLHLHTLYSDGTFSPAELVARSQELGFQAIAITDHDSVEALIELKTSNIPDLEIIPGIELSAYFDEEEVHILGYFMRFEEIFFTARLKRFCEIRQSRVVEIIEKLNRLGCSIALEDVLGISQNHAPGRLHIARALQQKKIVSHTDEAFQRFLGSGKPAYVPKEKISTREAIQLIRSAGGIPVVAHPGFLKSYETIVKMAHEGLLGIEVHHSKHSPSDVRHLTDIARKENLIITGGSDCHGLAKGKVLLGSIKLPYEHVERMKELCIKVNAA